nr:hypothetical protein [Synechococcus elongatus]
MQKQSPVLKLCLNLTIRPSMQPTAIVGMVLKQFGLSTVMQRDGGNCQTRLRTRYYRLEQSSLKQLKTLLQTRAKHYQEQGFRLRPHPLTLLLLEGVATTSRSRLPSRKS